MTDFTIKEKKKMEKPFKMEKPLKKKPLNGKAVKKKAFEWKSR